MWRGRVQTEEKGKWTETCEGMGNERGTRRAKARREDRIEGGRGGNWWIKLGGNGEVKMFRSRSNRSEKAMLHVHLKFISKKPDN